MQLFTCQVHGLGHVQSAVCSRRIHSPSPCHPGCTPVWRARLRGWARGCLSLPQTRAPPALTSPQLDKLVFLRLSANQAGDNSPPCEPLYLGAEINLALIRNHNLLSFARLTWLKTSFDCTGYCALCAYKPTMSVEAPNDIVLLFYWRRDKCTCKRQYSPVNFEIIFTTVC